MCNANTRNKIYLLHIRTDIRREKNGNTQNITSASWPCRVRVNARVVPFSFWFCWFFCGCFDFSLSYVLPKRFETATKDFNFAKRVCVCWWFAEQKTTSLKEQFSFCTQVELIERCECAVRSAVLFLLYCAQFTVTTTNSNTRPKNKNFNEILRSQFTILRLHLYVRVCFRSYTFLRRQIKERCCINITDTHWCCCCRPKQKPSDRVGRTNSSQQVQRHCNQPWFSVWVFFLFILLSLHVACALFSLRLFVLCFIHLLRSFNSRYYVANVVWQVRSEQKIDRRREKAARTKCLAIKSVCNTTEHWRTTTTNAFARLLAAFCTFYSIIT